MHKRLAHSNEGTTINVKAEPTVVSSVTSVIGEKMPSASMQTVLGIQGEKILNLCKLRQKV